MADFCLQCNLELMMGPHSDFDGLITKEQFHTGMRVQVLCEGCGVTKVDDRGRCIDTGCLQHGHMAPEAVKVLRSAEAWLARRSGPLGAVYRLRDRFLGTPWEPGLIHHWRWQWNAWRHRNRPRSSITVTIDAIDPKNLELFFFGGSTLEQTDSATGVEAPRKDDPGAPKSGVVRDEDIGPI